MLQRVPADVDVGLSVGISVSQLVLIPLGELDRIQLGNFFVCESVKVAPIDLVELGQLELLPDDVYSGLVRTDQLTSPNLEKVLKTIKMTYQAFISRDIIGFSMEDSEPKSI